LKDFRKFPRHRRVKISDRQRIAFLLGINKDNEAPVKDEEDPPEDSSEE
jgi:hypothetical protein